MALTPNVYLEIDVDNKRARIVDSTNYSENDISLSSLSAKGLGTVTSPTGDAIIVANTVSNPLVNLAVSTNGQYFDLPLDTSGNILNGTYSFTYSVRYAIVNGTINSITATSTAELEFVHAGAVLEDGDSIVFAGNGDAENNGTFTIATATYDTETDNSTITVDETTLVTDASPAGTYSFDVTRSSFASGTYTYTGCDAITLEVTSTYDCKSTTYGQIIFTDTTSYGSQELTARVLTGYYPQALTPAPASQSVSTSATNIPSLTFNQLAVGTWSYKLVSTMEVTQADGLVYTYTLTKTAEVDVTCTGTLCGLTPCLESLKDNFLANYAKGTANNLIPLLVQVNTLFNLAKEYQTCGDDAAYQTTVNQLETVLNESGACSCGCCNDSTDVPYWVNNGDEQTSVFDELFAIVGGLQLAVQNDADANAAYAALIASLTAVLADSQEINTELNTIQSNIVGLNPSDPAFDDVVDSIESLLLISEVNVGDLQDALTDVIAELALFNTNYPQYQAYTIAAATLFNSVDTALAAIPTDIDALQTLLAALTAANYDTNYADVLDEINNLTDAFAFVYSELLAVQASIVTINTTINTLLSNIVDLQNQIDGLQVSGSKVQPLASEVNVNSIDVFVPAKYLTKGGYVKFIIKGKDSDSLNSILIRNVSTSYNLCNLLVEDDAYSIELVLIPNVNVDPFVFKLGGFYEKGGVPTTFLDATINSTTEVEYATDSLFRIISDTSITNDFYSVEVYGYDLTFN